MEVLEQDCFFRQLPSQLLGPVIINNTSFKKKKKLNLYHSFIQNKSFFYVQTTYLPALTTYSIKQLGSHKLLQNYGRFDGQQD